MRNEEPVPITPKAFETLVVLVRKSGRLVVKEELMKEVWPDQIVEESNLSHSIYLLRKALGNDVNLYIQTVPKHGYRLIANVKEVAAEGAELALRERTSARILVKEDSGEGEHDEGQQAQVEVEALTRASTNRPSSRRPSPLLISSSALLICAALFAYVWVIREKGKAAGSLSTRTIAVLPFKPIDPESSRDHLGLGMTDATITKLSTLRQFTVRPASAVFKYTDRAYDSATIGRALGVDAVLEGTVQRSGDDVRVTVQLINVADGQSLWAQKFDARFTNILAVQDAISEQVAEALKLKLTIAALHRSA